jgi:hypothetical protein
MTDHVRHSPIPTHVSLRFSQHQLTLQQHTSRGRHITGLFRISRFPRPSPLHIERSNSVRLQTLQQRHRQTGRDHETKRWRRAISRRRTRRCAASTATARRALNLRLWAPSVPSRRRRLRRTTGTRACFPACQVFNNRDRHTPSACFVQQHVHTLTLTHTHTYDNAHLPPLTHYTKD